MSVTALLQPVLSDDLLTRGLGDEEARLLVEWLADRAVEAYENLPDADQVGEMLRLCRRARAASRFVYLWCHQGSHGAACQLAASERFRFPLPLPEVDPYDLMRVILECEENDVAELARVPISANARELWRVPADTPGSCRRTSFRGLVLPCKRRPDERPRTGLRPAPGRAPTRTTGRFPSSEERRPATSDCARTGMAQSPRTLAA